MAQNNSINNKTSTLTVDPGASGDSFIQHDINAVNKYITGVDDVDGDAYKISQGNDLGTNNHFKMTTDGERLLPLNPCFLVYLASDDSNVTGAGTTYTLGTNVAFTEVFDQGNHTSLNPVTFTAPVTGRYLFNVNIGMRGLTVATADLFAIQMVTSNRTYYASNSYTPLFSFYSL